MNAADMVAFVRDCLNEETASFWSDLNLLRRLNMSQDKVFKMVSMTPGQWLVKKSDALTPTDSVLTLPSDCAKPSYLESASGKPIKWLDGGVSYRRVSRYAGTSLDSGINEAYILQGTIEINTDNFAENCYLWYQRRPPRLHQGTAGASSAASALHLAADRERILLDDYYNGVTVEVIDQTSGIVDIRSTITDYASSTGIATVTGTPASGDTYGTISILPEETHMLMVFDTIVSAMMKPSAKLDKEVINYYKGEVRDQKKIVDEWLASRIIEHGGTAIGDLY